MGILKIEGTIDLAQFWPTGSSDADTTKLEIAVSAGSFMFAADSKTFVRTDVLDEAVSIGKAAKAIVTNGKVTIRLQGIDAPELHYRAAPLKAGAKGVTPAKRKTFNELNRQEHRQNWGESATLALAKRLATAAVDGKIACTVQSNVDAPSDLVDVYGRVVADVFITGDPLSLNRWLVQNGWAVPTFYSSMTADEIQVLLADMKKGKTKKRVISDIVKKVPKFDAKLVYRPPSTKPKPARDGGPLLMPKLFRRQEAYELQKAAKIITGNFKTYLEDNPDQVFLTDEFLDVSIHSAQEFFLDMFITPGGKIEVGPEELVFKEKPAFVQGADGKKLLAF